MSKSNPQPRWKAVPQYQNQLRDTGDNNSVSVQYGEDTMYLYTHYFEIDPPTATACNDFPHLLLSNSTSPNTSFFGPAGVLGLGELSTNLGQLADNNVITSRSFGLYLGAGYDRAGGVVNGSITFGGFDSGRFISPVHNYTLAPSVSSPTQSPFQVHVSQITLDFPELGGGSINLINDTGFAAEITTSQYPLSLPQSVTQAFASALQATPANNVDNSLRLTSPFSGNMTITLSDGFQVSFPPEWVSNISGITPIAATSSDTYALGAAFLQYVYLAVNYDSAPPAFHLARAVLENAYVMPRPLCPNIAPTAWVPPQLSHFTRAGLAGAAVGSVIGGSAVTLLVFVLVQNYLRRRQRKKKSVRFAEMGAEKGVEMVDIEEIEQTGNTPATGGRNPTGQKFVFRPPLTPGQPITPGLSVTTSFPEPRPGAASTVKGPPERKPVVTTFDPPPAKSIAGDKKQKSSR
jgi:hypothetical protein